MKSLVFLVGVSISLSSARATSVVGPWIPIFKGVDHSVGTNTPGGTDFPSLLVVHALRIDLTDPDIRLIRRKSQAFAIGHPAQRLGAEEDQQVRLRYSQIATHLRAQFGMRPGFP